MSDCASPPLEIREAEPADIDFIVDGNLSMALETERKQLDRAVLTRGVSAVFAQPTRGFYLIAKRGGERVGCLMVTYEWSDWRNCNWWWLQSVYVAPHARRSGVFRALHGATAARAAAAGAVAGLRLYVERDNVRAHATYASLGMREAQYAMWEGRVGDAAPARAAGGQVDS